MGGTAICGTVAPGDRSLPRSARAPEGSWRGPGVTMTGGGGAVMLDADIVVVADARLDNRAILTARLRVAPALPDALLIAAAYRRWGITAPERLEGTFAFALWDARKRRLLCARDIAGVRPLYYRAERGTLRFAQSADALEVPGQARTLRDEAVADFLYGRVLDHTETWFPGTRRLPAGHSLLFENGSARLRRNGSITAAPPSARNAAPAETLRALLDAAVARRVEGEEQVGVLLSGGLDSSAIACLLRDRRMREGSPPLPVFSMMFREPERSNERRHLDAVLATGGFAPHVIELDGYAPLADFDTLLAATAGPTLSPNLACMRHVGAAAAERGITVLLDGHGGDEVVSHGYGLLDELAGRGAWLSLLQEARGAADNYGRSRLMLMRRIAARQQRLDARILAKLLAPFDRASASGTPTHLLSRDLVERSRLRERLRTFAKPEQAATERAQHLAVLRDPLQPYAFEVHAAFYRSMGVEARYPFWDRQVAAFCLGLPAKEKLSQGWSRLVLRRAMAGVVPDSVLKRRDKIDFTVHLARGLVRHHHEHIMDLLASRASPLAPYLDLSRALATYEAIAAAPDAASGRSVQMIWRSAALGIWLESGCGAQLAPAEMPQEVAA